MKLVTRFKFAFKLKCNYCGGDCEKDGSKWRCKSCGQVND